MDNPGLLQRDGYSKNRIHKITAWTEINAYNKFPRTLFRAVCSHHKIEAEEAAAVQESVSPVADDETEDDIDIQMFDDVVEDDDVIDEEDAVEDGDDLAV